MSTSLFDLPYLTNAVMEMYFFRVATEGLLNHVDQLKLFFIEHDRYKANGSIEQPKTEL